MQAFGVLARAFPWRQQLAAIDEKAAKEKNAEQLHRLAQAAWAAIFAASKCMMWKGNINKKEQINVQEKAVL